MRLALLSLAAATALAGCAESGPAPTTATTGTGSRPLEQRAFEQPHSPNASAGAPTITGNTGQGQPIIERGGAAPGTVGGTNSAPRAVGQRGDKGG